MAVTITKQPGDGGSSKELAVQESVDLIVEAKATGTLAFEWRRNTTSVGAGEVTEVGSGTKRSTLSVTMDADGKEAAGTYVCSVKDEGDQSSDDTNSVEILLKAKSDDDTSPEAPIGSLVYDSGFAKAAARRLTFAGVLVLAVLAAFAFIAFDAKVNTADEGVWRALSAMVIALGLLAAGVLFVCGGLYVLIVEMRGRMKAPEAQATSIPMGLGAESLKAVADVVSSLAKVRGAIAALILACIPLVGAAWIGVSTSSESTTTTTSTTSPPASGGTQSSIAPAPGVSAPTSTTSTTRP